MNFVLHGLFFQVIVSIVQFQHGFSLCSAGEPGYLDFDNLPETNFSCQGKVIGGYYADVEAGCQMFHVCTIGQKDEIMDIKFLCLNGTVFDQETRVCERVDEVDCSKSERFYNLNLELYGNNAVTLSLHDSSTDSEDESTEVIDESHESQRTTSSRPTTTTTTTTTTQRAILSSTTSASGPYQHPNGYPQHYQPQPRFPSVQTSQSTSLYDDKNGGYHHQYIYHTGDHRTNNLENAGNNNNQNHNRNGNDANVNDNNNDQATSYQLFNNQGVVSTTANPQIHQIRYSSTTGPQIQIRNDHQPTIAPIFHATSSTIQTLLNSNANSPTLINPIFHNHGIASTTEQFNVHNNNPREIDEYQDNVEDESDNRNHEDRRPLEPIQPSVQGKISKLKISSIAVQQESVRTVERNNEANPNTDQQRITSSYLSTPKTDTQVRSFYPTPRTSAKSSTSHVTQHIHLPPPPSIPLLKPHQVTINISPPDIQRIVQNPSPLLPSQSRVIVTAKASVSDESGRPLNSTQLVTLPLPTIPASYDDYKEGDESFDPFYRDVPKIRNNRRIDARFRWPARELREKRSTRRKRDLIVDKIEGATMNDRLGTGSTDDVSRKLVKSKPHEDIRLDDEHNEDLMSRSSKSMADSESTSAEHQPISDSRESKNKGEPNDSERTEAMSIVPNDTKLRNAADNEETDTEISPVDNFDYKIFDDPESQNSKDVDTRAVSDDSKYSLDRNNNFDNGAKKSQNKNLKDLGSSGIVLNDESSRFSLELPETLDSKTTKGKLLSESPELKENTSEEEEDVRDGSELEDDEQHSRQVSGEEYVNDDYYYDGETDTSGMKSKEEDSVELAKGAPNKIDSLRHRESSDPEEFSKLENRSTEENSYEDENKELLEERFKHDYESSEIPATHGSEEITSSEMSREYDSEQNVEDSHENQNGKEDTFIFHDHASGETKPEDSQEVPTSTDEIFPSQDSKEDEDSQGVLKFTDEIPTTEEIDEPEESSKSLHHEDTPQDYIDDNYEAQNYKEKEEHPIRTDAGVTGIFHEVTTIETNGEVEEAEMSTDPTTSIMNVQENKEHKKTKLNDETKLEEIMRDEDQVEKSTRPIELEGITTTSGLTTTTFAPTAAITTMPITTTAIPVTTLTSTTATLTTMATASTTASMTTTTVSSTESTTTTTRTTPTTAATVSTTATTTTTPRPTPPKLFKPFTLRKSYVYVPPSTTPVPVIIKPRLTLLNPKPAKPPKSYNDYAPKPIIRKTLFQRKFPPTQRTTTPPVENVERSTKIFVSSTEMPNTETTVQTGMPTTTEFQESSTPIATSSTSEAKQNLMIEENNVPTLTTEKIITLPTIESHTFTPYTLIKMTEASSTSERIAEVKSEETTKMSNMDNNDVPTVSEIDIVTSPTTIELPSSKPSDPDPSVVPSDPKPQDETHELKLSGDSAVSQSTVVIDRPKADSPIFAKVGGAYGESVTENSILATTLVDTKTSPAPTLTSLHGASRKNVAVKRIASFNCLEKKMYRFYADVRDCRLFHYCSPGFTSRQVLDFRFVCEEGTAFDEESQSCVHDLNNFKCRKRVW